MSYYYDSPDLTFSRNGMTTERGHANLGRIPRPGYGGVTSMDITIRSSETIVLARNVACTMVGGMHTADFQGSTTPEQSFLFTAVWVRGEGEWKIHVMHVSPPPDTTNKYW
jgi:hypothetical protein